MRITVDDISNQIFQVGMRGYNTTEVDTFMQVIGDDYGILIRENQGLRRKNKELADNLTSTSEHTSTLQQAAEVAQKIADEAIANGHKSAELIVNTARLEQEKILHQAKVDAAKVRQQAEATIVDLTRQIAQLHQREQDTWSGLLRNLELVKTDVEKHLADASL